MARFFAGYVDQLVSTGALDPVVDPAALSVKVGEPAPPPGFGMPGGVVPVPLPTVGVTASEPGPRLGDGDGEASGSSRGRPGRARPPTVERGQTGRCPPLAKGRQDPVLEELEARPSEIDGHAPAERVEHGEGEGRGLLLLDHPLRGDHPVVPAGPQLVEVGDGAVGVGQVVLGLPGPVGVHLVHEVGRHLLPAELGVLGQGHRHGVAHRAWARVGPAEADDLVGVVLPDRGVAGQETVGDAGGALGRRPGAASEHHGGPARPEGRRGHLHRAAPELEGPAREGRLEGGHRLGHPLAPLAHGHVEHGELLVDVAPGDHQVDAAPAEVVEHHHVLGEAERVVEGGDERGHHEPDLGRARRHGRQHRDGARKVAVS